MTDSPNHRPEITDRHWSSDFSESPLFQGREFRRFVKGGKEGFNLQFLVNYGLTNKFTESVVSDGIETKANQFLKT